MRQFNHIKRIQIHDRNLAAKPIGYYKCMLYIVLCGTSVKCRQVWVQEQQAVN